MKFRKDFTFHMIYSIKDFFNQNEVNEKLYVQLDGHMRIKGGKQ
ncbi:hypothetical protein N783_21735 [Pontibacillus marinus BH030004 = DSM 16465]|uniref:Uncharacterized protein n=1 Tax=Pontibacillus marinus BH030004 = DSM 16465 TaxID=1385511 RepID=A0A0A5FY72_9BACI|nr:hypothetical protein N783_21735 [Pontibacillus marinus BH030004 = DSM 16465]